MCPYWACLHFSSVKNLELSKMLSCQEKRVSLLQDGTKKKPGKDFNHPLLFQNGKKWP